MPYGWPLWDKICVGLNFVSHLANRCTRMGSCSSVNIRVSGNLRYFLAEQLADGVPEPPLNLRHSLGGGPLITALFPS